MVNWNLKKSPGAPSSLALLRSGNQVSCMMNRELRSKLPSSCARCSSDKKRCDKNRPCKRCVSFGHKCTDKARSVGTRPRGLKYTRNPCAECTVSKVKCDGKRPCGRCVRRDIACGVSCSLKLECITPYRTGGYLPTPSTESMFQNYMIFLDTLSPFDLTDILSGSEMSFRSAITGMNSVLSFHRRRDFLERIMTLAELRLHSPDKIPYIANRVHSYLEPEQTAPLLALPPECIAYGYQDIDSLDNSKAIIEYYMHKYKFTQVPLNNGGRPGIMVSMFVDPEQVDGANHALIGTMNTEAMYLTGYTSEEYHNFQNVITPDFTNYDGFPQVLRVYHKDDIHIHMTKALVAFLKPGVEIPFEARLIHKTGHVVYARFSHVASVKPDGQLKSLVTAVVPVPCT